jgi:hypothetical protein
MKKREGELKSAFRAILKDVPGFYMLQLASRAAPDRLIIGAGRSTFWEFKHGTPSFDSPGDQELMCCRLAMAGYCRYVVWQESSKGFGQRTMIVHPEIIRKRDGWSLTPEAWCRDYNHHWLVNFILQVHRT